MLTKQETAKQLGISVSTLDRLSLRGEIAYYKIGTAKKYRQEDIEAYLIRVRVKAQPKREELPPAPPPQQKEKRGPGRPPRTSYKQTYYPGMKVV